MDEQRMRGIEIATAPDSLRMGTRGSIVGALSLRIDDLWFPDRNWTDLVVVVLGWWARETVCLEVGRPGRFRFMDGNFQFVVRPLPDGVRSVVSLGRGGQQAEAALGSCEMCTGDLVAAVRTAAMLVLDACAQRRWENEAIEELRVWSHRVPIERGAAQTKSRKEGAQ